MADPSPGDGIPECTGPTLDGTCTKASMVVEKPDDGFLAYTGAVDPVQVYAVGLILYGLGMLLRPKSWRRIIRRGPAGHTRR